MTKRIHAHRPKGSYPHPSGGYIVERSYATADGRRLKILAHHKADRDAEALARVFVRLAEDLRANSSLDP